MIKEGQIRKFKEEGLPSFTVSYIRDDTGEWFCVYNEEFRYQFISMSEEELEDKTILVED